MALTHGERVNSVASFQHRVPAKSQKLSGGTAQRLLIFHKKHRFSARTSGITNAICHFDGRSALGHTGEIDFERRAQTGLAVYPDKSMGLLHNSVNRRQPKPCAASGGLGGIKRFEDVSHLVSRYAD